MERNATTNTTLALSPVVKRPDVIACLCVIILGSTCYNSYVITSYIRNPNTQKRMRLAGLNLAVANLIYPLFYLLGIPPQIRLTRFFIITLIGGRATFIVSMLSHFLVTYDRYQSLYVMVDYDIAFPQRVQLLRIFVTWVIGLTAGCPMYVYALIKCKLGPDSHSMLYMVMRQEECHTGRYLLALSTAGIFLPVLVSTAVLYEKMRRHATRIANSEPAKFERLHSCRAPKLGSKSTMTVLKILCSLFVFRGPDLVTGIVCLVVPLSETNDGLLTAMRRLYILCLAGACFDCMVLFQRKSIFGYLHLLKSRSYDNCKSLADTTV